MLTLKMLRDMGRHKTQFISIFIMAFLAIFIYAGIGGEWRGMIKSANDYYTTQNLADVFLYGNGFDDDAEAAVASLSEVIETERRLKLDAVGKLSDSPNIALYFLEDNQISTPYLVSGNEFSADKDGIWVDKRFADARNLAVGDQLTVSMNGMELTKTIRGLVYSPEYVFLSEADTLTPDFNMYGYAFLSKEAFPMPERLAYNTLLIKTDERDMTKLEDRITAAIDGKYSVFLEQKNHPSVSMFQDEITQHRMIGDIFPIVFLLIALLTMLTTMTRIVSSQRIQIGTLKALGFKKSAVIRHYISYGFWLSLAGVICGGIAGPLTLPYLLYPSMSGFYTLPQWKPAFDVSFVVMGAGIVLLSTAVTWLACRKLLSDMPAETLRPKAPKVFKHGVLEHTRLWKKFGFNTQWNLRDASRNRVRSLMAIIGVFGCTSLTVSAFGMNKSMLDLRKWQYEDIYRFESKINLEEMATDAQIEDIIKAVDGEAVMEGTIEIKAGDRKKSGFITVLDHVSLIVPTDKNLKPATLPKNGISISAKMAEALEVTQGDTIKWHLYGDEKWIDSTIAAVYRDPTTQGLILQREYFERYGLKFNTTSILSSQKVTQQHEGAATVLSTSDILKGWDDLTEAMNIMVYLLIAAAVVLSIVVLYNLGQLSFTEMEREMATLKVMGLKSRKIRGLLLTQNIWFSAIGYILGLPGGISLIQVIVSSSGESFDFPVRLHWDTAVIAFIITFGLSVFVNLLFSGKIKKLNMVESLKAME